MTPGQYFRQVLRLWLPAWGGAIAGPVIVMFGYGVLMDARWIIVSMAFLFLACPMVMFLIYYNYTLSPEARRNLFPRRVNVQEGDRILIHYLPMGPGNPIPADETIPWEEIDQVRQVEGKTLYVLRKPRLSLIMV